ncbi:ester hydrolase C11orf54 homolog isoform X3 [Centroberyx affinis]|uniref:ester hydrolase C11orf54 homolog isoform X3 n=1 Tax=Centroberyx affinis TaxID=166261 RepID=UPI003A5BB571
MAEISKTEKVQLHVPTLEELCSVLQAGLKDNFAEAQVSVVDCPDLTKQPFQFPVKGLCGKPRITDVGGVPYLVPLVQKDKEYNMNTVSKEVELPGAFILGAAAAPFRIAGMNAELMPLVLTEAEGRPAVNSSYFSSINPADGQCLQERFSDKFSGCDFGLLGNLYACEGKPGKPREFSVCPLDTNDKVNNWLQHFEVSAPLICQSVLVSRDPGLDLRVEHTHCFSHHGEGGHYYIDTTPDSVEYLGYFMPAEFVYRIDRPKETHVIGRD